MMRSCFLMLVFTFMIISTDVCNAQGIFLVNEDRPSLIDRLLQVVWEPSSLIRMWVGLDQLYNIARSWRGVAENIATLPFREGRSMSHVRIQEPRRATGRINIRQRQSDMSHWDRFNKVYSSSNLQPSVAESSDMKRLVHFRPQTQFILPQYQGLTMLLQNQKQLLLSQNQRKIILPQKQGNVMLPSSQENLALPHPSLFLPQEVFVTYDMSDGLHGPKHFDYSSPMANRDDEALVSKLFAGEDLLQLPTGDVPVKSGKHNGERIVTRNHINPRGVVNSNVVLNTNPQSRLNMFLRLMKSLGEMHGLAIDTGNNTEIGKA